MDDELREMQEREHVPASATTLLRGAARKQTADAQLLERKRLDRLAQKQGAAGTA